MITGIITEINVYVDGKLWLLGTEPKEPEKANAEVRVRNGRIEIDEK